MRCIKQIGILIHTIIIDQVTRPATLAIIIANVFVFIVSYLAPNEMDYYLVLRPILVTEYKFLWQVFTYMFMHGGFWHIALNMLILLMFGMQLERHWGSSEFLAYYLFSGIGAGLFILIFNMATGDVMTATLGASGAVYGLLLAFATLFPRANVYLMGLIPVRAPIFVLGATAVSLFSQITGLRGGISHIGHLAGFLFGYIYFLVRMGINPIKVFFDR